MTAIDKQSPSNNSDEIYLKDIILNLKGWVKFLLSKTSVILICAVIGAVIGFAYAYFKKPTYTAELTFALQDEKTGGSLSGALGLASQFGIDIGGMGSGGEFSGDNLLELMKSRSIIEKTLLKPVVINGKQQTLADLYIYFNKLKEKWDGKPDMANIQYLPEADPSKFTTKQDSILGVFREEILKSNLIVDKVDKKLSIISIKVTSKNEMFSKWFTEVLTKVTSDYYIQTKTEKAARNVAVLQKQTDSVRRELNSAITGVAASADANPNPNPIFQTLRVPSQRRQVDVQANTAILSELVKNLEISKMSLMQATPLIQIIDQPILPLKKDKVSKLLGLIIGGMVGAVLIITLLSLRKMFSNIMGN